MIPSDVAWLRAAAREIQTQTRIANDKFRGQRVTAWIPWEGCEASGTVSQVKALDDTLYFDILIDAAPPLTAQEVRIDSQYVRLEKPEPWRASLWTGPGGVGGAVADLHRSAISVLGPDGDRRVTIDIKKNEAGSIKVTATEIRDG